MLRAEAAWLGRELAMLPTEDLSPLLSIGSGDAELRTVGQPWIERLIYEPLARRGVTVLHHELDPAPGVDVTGDLTDAAFLERLPDLAARSIICCNVLEHVPDPGEVAAAIERAVAPGGYALITAPRRYPYHPGPIDTLYRPNADELGRLFPGLTPVTAAGISCESLIGYLLASPRKRSSLAGGLRTVKRDGAAPMLGPRPTLRESLRMLISSTEITALVLRAPPS